MSVTVLEVLCEEWDSSTGFLLRVLRAEQFYGFTVKGRAVL
jgi:hypothetical protein